MSRLVTYSIDYDGEESADEKNGTWYKAADVDALHAIIRQAFERQGPWWTEWKDGKGSSEENYDDWLHRKIYATLKGQP